MGDVVCFVCVDGITGSHTHTGETERDTARTNSLARRAGSVVYVCDDGSTVVERAMRTPGPKR